MLNISATDDAITIKLEADRLEAANASTFKSLLAELPVLKEKKVILDMKPVRFIDSSGIGAILGLLTRLNPKDNKLHLINAQTQVANVIRMLRLEAALQVEDSP